jgi:hypothetical protein
MSLYIMYYVNTIYLEYYVMEYTKDIFNTLKLIRISSVLNYTAKPSTTIIFVSLALQSQASKVERDTFFFVTSCESCPENILMLVSRGITVGKK